MSEQRSVEKAAHGIVAERESHSATVIYTCRCGEIMQCHPDLRDEALAFHLTRVTSPGAGDTADTERAGDAQ
jgi:hypothetical protein